MKKFAASVCNIRSNLLVFSFLFLSACGGNSQEKIPKNIYSKAKMEAILTDIHIVEGAKTGRKMIGDTLFVEDYYAKVYQKHETTQEDFDRSFRFYTDHPYLMKGVYKEVIENLNKLEKSPPRDLELRGE